MVVIYHRVAHQRRFRYNPDPTRHDYFTISSPGAPAQPVICGTMQVVVMDDCVDGDGGDSGDDRYVIICHMWHHAGSDDNGDEVRIVLMVMVVMINMFNNRSYVAPCR